MPAAQRIGSHFCGDAGRGGKPLPVPSAAADRRKTSWGGLEGRSPPTVIRTRRRARRVRKPCAVRFSRIDKWNTLLRGCRKGRPAPSCAIRSDKPLWGGLEGRSPPNAIRTRRHVRRVRKSCAARFPCTFPRPRPQAQGKRVLAEKAGSAGLFRQAGAAASRFRYHVPAVRFAHRNMMSPSLQG